MTPVLALLIAGLLRELKRVSAPLAVDVTAAAVAAWRGDVARLLALYHTAALLAGQGGIDLGAAAQALLVRQVGTQLRFLDRFALQIETDATWDARRAARALSYAAGLKSTYWRGATDMLPLPAMPAEGTLCLNMCGCKWRIVWLDRKNRDADCYWERDKDDSCATCIARERAWSPLRIRGGELI